MLDLMQWNNISPSVTLSYGVLSSFLLCNLTEHNFMHDLMNIHDDISKHMARIFLESVFSPDDTVGDLKKLISAQTGTKWDRIVLKKW